VAVGLFASQGYRGTSMKDIARGLEVSAPSLYNHVPSKQQLLYEIMDEAMSRAQLVLEEALAGVDDVSEQLRRATMAFVLDFLSHADEITVCNTEIRSLEEPHRAAIIGKRNAFAGRVRAIIDRGCAEGRFHAAHPRVAAFAVLELGSNAKAWFNQRGEFSAGDVASMYAEFALHIVADDSARRSAPSGSRATAST
jgi:AcrR family transcriptional regulator